MMKYFIVYWFTRNGANGIGTVDGVFNHNPPTIEDLKSMGDEIAEKFNLNEAMILNWLPISGESEVKHEDS